MPLIHISLFEGRTVEQKRELAQAITSETCRVLKIEPSSVDIIYEDIKKHDWATAGKLWSDPR
ncbi:MAG: 4-oxalocrotonate tautomerase [Burkholderiales bacterium]|nr:4-oxalocrotonate tautomerase [Burkholderiales bacterium]